MDESADAVLSGNAFVSDHLILSIDQRSATLHASIEYSLDEAVHARWKLANVLSPFSSSFAIYASDKFHRSGVFLQEVRY